MSDTLFEPFPTHVTITCTNYKRKIGTLQQLSVDPIIVNIGDKKHNKYVLCMKLCFS